MEKLINKKLAPEFPKLIYRSILKVHRAEAAETEKAQSLYRLISLVLEELTRDERIHFTTQFARIAYVGSRFDLSSKLLYGLHHLRKLFESDISQLPSYGYKLALFCASWLVKENFQHDMDPALQKVLPKTLPVTQQKFQIQKYEAFLRVFALSYLEGSGELEVVLEDHHAEKKRLVIEREERNSLFSASLKRLYKNKLLPIHLNLLNVEIDLDGKLHPQAVVIDPDYLVDVTAIAGCFKRFGSDPRMQILHRFLPVQNNIHLMIGNIANYILDEIINQPEIEFAELKQKLFALDPMGFASFEDKIVREILQKIQLHFVNLKKVILRDFKKVGIDRNAVYLEPSYYSPEYGIQGRLDVLHQSENGQTDIVELKSGKVFRPNAYGLNQNHYIQTILYDLLVKKTVRKDTRITSYILYSSQEDRSLRFAPAIQAKQFEALAVRNAMVETELYLARQNSRLTGQIINSLQGKYFPNAKGFLLRDIQRFEKVYQSLDDLEKAYFNAFSGFIYRELRLAKTGIQDVDQLNGMAGLWLNSQEFKKEQFVLLNHLIIHENQSAEADALIYLRKTDQTAELAKFRVGDIVVFYPETKRTDEYKSSQVFKSTIVEIDHEMICIRLRSQQKNQTLFKQYTHWNLEYDFMESGFNGMFRGLFEFSETRKDYRDLMMTNRPPEKPYTLTDFEIPEGLNEEQAEIFKDMITANEYYLLWGPPGTGKTSRMIRSLVQYLFFHTKEKILVMSYTNRAVDELCEAIITIHDQVKANFLRIGSRYSVGEEYKELLLREKMEEIDTRAGLIKLLSGKRIICGTVASVLGKQDLFSMMGFDRVIIDEASQILEPLLVGTLARFPKRILVGDHLQLPAVVAQSEQSSEINNKDLKAIGLKNSRNSLFERLYLRCQEENWDWAIGQLSQQGRMHEDLMNFPNKTFYQSSLSVMQGIDRLRGDLTFKSQNEASKIFSSHRLIYIPTQVDDDEIQLKTNRQEAILVAELVLLYQQFIKKADLEWNVKDIGVITPFRAQIAGIKKLLQEKLGKQSSEITVDTVERYQGGARQLIIISFCANHTRYLERMQSLSGQGVDRKLNVALTRAREQIIFLGNEEILQNHPQINALIQHAFRLEKFPMKT